MHEVSVPLTIFLYFAYCGISFLALVGNGIVLWIVLTCKPMQTVTNVFIANLAVADIIIGVFVPFWFRGALLQRNTLPDLFCYISPFAKVLSVTVSIFTLVAIAVDRYKAVIHPLVPNLSKRVARWIVTLIWFFGFLVALPSCLFHSPAMVQDEMEGMKPVCVPLGVNRDLHNVYKQSLVIIQYVIPLSIITVAYVKICMNLWKSKRSEDSQENRLIFANKKKVIKMLLLVTILFAICWLPLQAYNFLRTISPSIHRHPYIHLIWFCSNWLAMSNSCANPFIYAIYNDKFQNQFRSKFRFLMRENLVHQQQTNVTIMCALSTTGMLGV